MIKYGEVRFEKKKSLKFNCSITDQMHKPLVIQKRRIRNTLLSAKWKLVVEDFKIQKYQ